MQGKVERLLDWSSGGDASAGVAIPTLAKIVGDGSASMRQRLKAAAAILGYKLPDDDVAEFTKRFLQSVCTSADIATDYRIEAGELLRKHEAPRVAPETVRLVYQEEPKGEPPIPLQELVAQRRARADALEREMMLQMEREMGLQSGEPEVE